MKFDELDKEMRLYEQAHDHCVLPGIYIVARLDGRNFTTLTKRANSHHFIAPFDVRFREMMVSTTKHLMQCGFRTAYGYTESDEISILLHLNDNTFGRKLRKINSVLAGEASAKFSMELEAPAVFDCRVSQLPSQSLVTRYFKWRQSDSERNSLNSHCYWYLRNEGLNAKNATKRLLGLFVGEKHDLLMQSGINYNNLPTWQKRGIGVAWQGYDKIGFNPVTAEEVVASRRCLNADYELPMGDAYSTYVSQFIS